MKTSSFYQTFNNYRVLLLRCCFFQRRNNLKKLQYAAVRLNVFSCLLNSVQLTSLSRRLAGKLFQIRGPAAAKHLVTKTTVYTGDSALSPRIGLEIQ